MKTINILPNSNNNVLYEQLSVCTGVRGKALDFVTNYLLTREINTLDTLTDMDLLDYRRYVRLNHINKYYENLLEQVCFAYLISQQPQLMELVSGTSVAIRNKTIGYMLLRGKRTPDEIDYDLRRDYQDYLEATLSSKVSEYLKALDILKLESIKQHNLRQHLQIPQLKYSDTKIFLLYHPEYRIAKTFYYTRDKEELLFDFSIGASSVLKNQIYRMLIHTLETNNNLHDRRERFLIPLKLLYQFCIKHGIDDIEQLTEKQITGFRREIDGKVGSKTDTYMQLVDNIRKFLFVSSTRINWDANVWYLERLNLKDERLNPAREIRCITFGQVENEKNRALLKQYMKYQIGITSKYSIQTIRCQYYNILSFLLYLDGLGVSADAATSKVIEKYIKTLDKEALQPENFNRKLFSVEKYYGYLITKKVCSKIPIHIEYYYKKTFPKHSDRFVPTEVQMTILANLKNFPVHLCLMYLHLWCIGLRINEVCTIKGNAYSFDGNDAWITIYQYKLKAEKMVPI